MEPKVNQLIEGQRLRENRRKWNYASGERQIHKMKEREKTKKNDGIEGEKKPPSIDYIFLTNSPMTDGHVMNPIANLNDFPTPLSNILRTVLLIPDAD